MKYTFILFALLYYFSVQAQYRYHTEKSVAEIVSDISQTNNVYGKHVGYGGNYTNQYHSFVLLKQEATTEQIFQLVNHDSASVRCYAFWALVQQQHDSVFSILEKNLSDTATVVTFFGCFIGHPTVADFCIKTIMKNDITLAQKNRIDSLVLYQYTDLYYLNTAFFNVQPNNQNHYQQIRKLALQGEHIAIIPLSKFKKSQDTSIILSFADGYTTSKYKLTSPTKALLYAIKNFPNKAFFPYLKENAFKKYNGVFRGRSKEYYHALLQYNTLESVELLNEILTLIKEEKKSEIWSKTYNLKEMMDALSDYPTLKTDSLIIDSWKTTGCITLKAFNHLKNKDKKMIMELIESHFYSIPNSYNKFYDSSYEIFDNIIPFYLENADTTQFKKFIPLAKVLEIELHNRSSIFVKLYISELKTSSNDIVLQRCTTLIKAYNDRNLRRKASNALKLNSNISRKQFKELRKQLH
ncbi:MAG: hypothetical protein GY827_10325 [Cytophagales bacterium]|nr:hypothetical protein [Cytophagales bacterium]